MEYTREYWQAREGTKLNKFTKVNETTSTVELVNAPESITVAGTEVTTTRLNNMESGITGAVAGVNEIQGVVDFTITLGTLTNVLENKYITDVLNVSGDIYACVYNGDIYKQTGGVGSFVALGQTSRPWIRLATNGTDVYAIVTQGGIYKQTAKSGDFVSVYSSSLYWSKIEAHNNDIYASAANGSIYKQSGGSGSFVEVGTYSGSMKSLFSHKGDLYYITDRNALYRKNQGDDTFSFLRSIDVYSYMRSAEAGLFCYYDGYLSIVDDDIRLQKNIEQVLNFSSFTSIEDKMYLSTETSNGDIYTATILTGNTFRAPSSFSLPAMPDGARKRILNTHASDAITVTAYSGTTIEGQATMTLSAWHEVELELIGTDWKKTGWNEAALLTYSQPVDNTSRVAEYTGDGGGATIKDRAGNGNNLTATNITYVNGKYGKEMSFNGSTSYAQASSPVIGTTGTIAVRFKINATTAGDIVTNTSNATFAGFRLRVLSGGSLNAFIASSSSQQDIALVTLGTTQYYTIVLSWDGTTVTKTIGGVTTTEAQTVSMAASSYNLTFGRYAHTVYNFLNGIISHFRYDSRIWTAEEARAWSLNPISIDSRE